MADKAYKLSPSDFGFLWDECRRCFYLKVVRDFPRPSAPFPKIFNAIDEAMKTCFMKIPSEQWATGVPAGKFHKADGWVQSKAIKFDGRKSSIYIKGIFDTVIELADGGFGVVDFKTSTVSASSAVKYGRQLHAYAFALGRPAPNELAIEPVTSLGLLVYQPNSFKTDGGAAAELGGKLAWLGIPKDDDKFVRFLDEVVSVLDLDEPPPAGPSCPYCKHRDAARAAGY